MLRFKGNTLASSNNKAELLALVEGLKLAVLRNLMPLEINMDCNDIISLIYNNNKSKYFNMLCECTSLLQLIGNSSPN